jgi:hypothetical protein
MSDANEQSFGQLTTMEDGEFAGWQYWQGDPYETRSGPFYHRREAGGSYVSAFRAEARHMNGGGFMHGGCMLTFADFALFAIATDELAGDHAVTLNLAVTRGGGKTIFVRGLVTGDGKPALSFTGIIRRLARR